MHHTTFSSLLSATAMLLVVPATAQITAINYGDHEWQTAKWTAGPPVADGTAFLNDNSNVFISDGSEIAARGVRIGNVTSSTATLGLDDGTLRLSYVVVGNSPDSHAAFYQSGGVLRIADTEYIDFDLGSIEGPATEPSTSQAIFSGGEAKLADVRFNLSKERQHTFTIEGSRADVSANLMTAAPQGIEWQKARIEFDFDRRGIAPLKLNGGLVLGDKDSFILEINGSDYTGTKSRFVLIESAYISGEFAEILIEGFDGGASVYAEENKIILTIP